MSNNIVTLHLTSNQIHTIKYWIEGFMARKVYKYMFANLNPSPPTLLKVTSYIYETYPNIMKLHDSIRDKFFIATSMHLEVFIMQYYHSCLHNIASKAI